MYGSLEEERIARLSDERLYRERRIRELVGRFKDVDGNVRSDLVIRILLDIDDGHFKNQKTAEREKDNLKKEIEALKNELSSVYDKLVELKVENIRLQREGKDGDIKLDK